MQEIDIFKLTREEQAHNPLEKILKDEINKRLVQHFLEYLKPREYYVILRRFGLKGFQEYTQKEIGIELTNLNKNKLGVSHAAVRVIEARALRRIRCKISQI